MRAAVFAIVVALGCGRVRFEAHSDAGADAPPPGACVFGPWGAPQRLAAISSTAEDAGPSLSADGLTLYFHSARVNVGDIFTAVRADRASPFGTVTNLAPLNGTNRDLDPTVTADQLDLVFSSDRTGGAYCLFESQRMSTADPWGAPAMLDTSCSAMPATGPFVTADGLTLYYAINYNQIVVTTRATRSAAFGPGVAIPGLPASLGATAPSLSSDGLTIYFDIGGDIYYAMRATPTDAFGGITAIAAVNSTSSDGDSDISADGTELYFQSTRAGGSGAADLYVSTRACQ